VNRDLLNGLGNAIAAVWIMGGAFWFHVRFALIVYHDRKNEIDALWSGALRFLHL